MSEVPQSQADRETDALAERFFSQPPQAWEVEPEAWRPSPPSQTERLAMLATVAPVVIGIAVAVGWLVLSNPLFASAEPGSKAVAKAAAAAPRATPDATQHGLTALAKAAPIAVPMQPAVQPSVSAPEPIAAAPIALAPIADAPIAVAPVAAAPTPVRTPLTATASTPLKRARQALDAGDPRRARELASEAIGREPTRAAAYIVLAGALDALGDRAGMQAAFRSCAERATDTLASACKSLSR